MQSGVAPAPSTGSRGHRDATATATAIAIATTAAVVVGVVKAHPEECHGPRIDRNGGGGSGRIRRGRRTGNCKRALP